MKVSDWIADFLIEKQITDIFGYPGGMLTHFMDSLGKREDQIQTHIAYHEQAAAFAACGYAQASGKVGVAFATSGPGATNLITGIGNAYFDSIPTLFITGQVNTFESKGTSAMRQRGFQETNIVPMVQEITKAAFYIDQPEDVCRVFREAYRVAMEGRRGPVLIDVPMNIFRSEIEPEQADCQAETKNPENMEEVKRFEECLRSALQQAKRPCLVLGNAVKTDRQIANIRGILRSCPLPVVTSMLAVDIVPEGQGLEGIYYGFIGAYGNRTANFVVAKSDLLICLGTRLDVRQVGGRRERFAPDAQIIRVDIDENELANTIRDDDYNFAILLKYAVSSLRRVLSECRAYTEWLAVCAQIKKQIKYMDEKEPNRYVNEISKWIPDGCCVTADVGQHMIWVAQSFRMKPEQRLYLSGGMGSMGYALPAAIGVYYATRKPVICFVGDGGLQMNLQELQFLVRDRLPIKIIVLNNAALGMIRHFQEMYFEGNYFYTTPKGGYTVPDFVKVADAYGIRSRRISEIEEIRTREFDVEEPELLEIVLKGDTYVFPKLEFGKPNQDQEPLLDRDLYNYLMEL